jgi:hypothetical protein
MQKHYWIRIAGSLLDFVADEKDISFADNGPGFRAHDARLIFGNRPEGGALVRVMP